MDDEYDDDTVVEYRLNPIKFRPAMLWHVPLILLEKAGEALTDISETLGLAVSAHIAYGIDQDRFHMEAAREIEALVEGVE